MVLRITNFLLDLNKSSYASYLCSVKQNTLKTFCVLWSIELLN
jgi:hypothetical protein